MSPPPPPQPLHSSLHQISTPSQHYQRQKPQQPQQPRQNNQRPHHQQSSLSSSNLLRGLQIVSPSNIPKGTDNDKNTHFHYNRGPSGVDGHRNNNDDSFGEDVGIITESGSGTSSSDDRLAGYRLKFEATPQADDEKAEEKEHKIKTSYTNAIDATIATALTQTAANQSQSTNICRPHFNPHLPSPTPPIYYQTLDQYPPNLPPPRSSSLLPPPRNAETNILSPVHAADPLANKTPTTSSRRHSRSSSLGAVSDGFRNLNRWSASTTSSRASNSNPNSNLNTTRDIYSHSQTHRQLLQSSPGRLVKRRPSNDTSVSSKSPPRTRRLSSPPPPPSDAPPNLPPILSLPPLDANPESVIYRDSLSPLTSRASPAEPQDQDPFLNDLPGLDSTIGNNALLPPAIVVRDTMPERKSHTRGRSSAAKSSTDSTRAKERASKPSQKAMLSKALAKANAAVQLDNAQNYVAAKDSYLEACDLLQQVLARTSGEEDRKKLEAIRLTYTSRIDELEGLVPAYPQNDKALPARPESFGDFHGIQNELAGVEDTTEATPAAIISRGESPTTDATHLRSSPIPGQDQRPLQSSFSTSHTRRNFEGASLSLPHPQGVGFVPAPLSPRRPTSPAKPPTPEPIVRQDFSWPSERLAAENSARSHRRNLSHESASWLDPIDESGGSASTSVHSRSSSLGVRRKHVRHASGNTEAEFDAALDAAVEAAYDDGYEPMDSYGTAYDDDGDNDDGVDVVVNAMRKVELAKERVRQTEREAAIELARERERQRQMVLGQKSQTFGGDFFDANDSDEEERMLEEMTKGYVMDEFALNHHRSRQSQSQIPRESDSSGMTSRTWHSSLGSNPPTATTVLSTVTEMPPPGSSPKKAQPSLSSPPQPQQTSPTSGVRNRRLSGQNPRQLKIETFKLGQPPGALSAVMSSVQTKTPGGYIVQQSQALSATSTRPGPFSTRAPSSPVRGIGAADAFGPPSPPAPQAGAQESEELRTDSPSSVRPGIRKNFSSSSLKSLKTRQFSISHIDDSDISPNTPLSYQISNTSISRQPTIPALPTPLAAAFHEKMTGGIGGLHLFDSDFHSPTSRSPNQLYHHHHLHHSPDVPIPLEPCPSDAMLRPFWLMRALYQTLAHPRGGYISNRLFVPRDAWKVKGVKLRALEDKMAQCDLLTAALLKLTRVDSNDADAVLEEMQSFENILEMVQVTLARKLGNEVGTQGVSAFREEGDADAAPSVPRSASISGKGGTFSWRRLRNKGSAANMTNAYGGKSNSGGSSGGGPPSSNEREAFSSTGSIPSLPMTAHPSSKPAKRDVASVNFDGPYGNYMASLARLFDAAQAVDQIARQVEDPGLRHADKTQVGLELCTRHAAEFFGFYICRFVLTDLAMLLDKFVKRGSEWVLN